MGQLRYSGLLLLLAAIIAGFSCKKADSGATASTQSAQLAKIASLSPAGTDLIIGMGLGPRLVAVSNFEPRRDATKDLPRVGDYQSTDWEQLGKIKPDIMIVQMAPDRMPEGLAQKAEAAGIKLVNIRIDKLEDVFAMTRKLGEELGEKVIGQDAASELQTQILQTRVKVIGKPSVPTLLVVGENGDALAGPGTFLDDILTEAGGANVAASLNTPYPSVDREKILAMKPQAIVQLLPGASEQVVSKAKSYWSTLGDVPAVKNNRVFIITDSDALLPGFNVGRLADKIATLLHGTGSATSPATTKAASAIGARS